jgi:hypothetical protein
MMLPPGSLVATTPTNSLEPLELWLKMMQQIS